MILARVVGTVVATRKDPRLEGKKLLTPEDDYDALKDFNHAYEGTTSILEGMHLEYQQLLKDYPDLAERLALLPGRVFSGKAHPQADARAVFFCWALPALSKKPDGSEIWSEENGTTGWHLYDLIGERIISEPADIIGLIRSTPATPRQRAIPDKTLSEIRTAVEKHIKNTYFKRVQAPIGVKAVLKAWMELG